MDRKTDGRPCARRPAGKCVAAWRRLRARLHPQYDLGNRGYNHLSKPADLVQGTLDLLILKILALEPLHGWAVSQRLKQVSSDVLQVSDGSLYPALHKLEQEGWITAEWKTSELGRRAKFYSLTRIGRRHLEKETADWERLSTAISHVVRLKEA
jgi:transcriptional regulator